MPYCNQEIDIIVKSSDYVHLGAHTRHLREFSNILSIANLQADGSICLPENSGVLRVLFECMHPVRHDWIVWDIQFLLEVAEAGEKYGVIPVIDICSLLLR